MPDVSVLNRNTAAEEVPIACNVPVWAASRVRLCFTSARGLALWPKCVSCDPVLPKREKKTCRWGTIFLLLYLVIIKITNSRKALGYRVSSIHSTQVTMRKYEKRVHRTVFLPCLPIYPCLRDRSTAYVPGKARKSLNGVSPLCYRSFHTRADWSTWAGMDNYFTIS